MPLMFKRAPTFYHDSEQGMAYWAKFLHSFSGYFTSRSSFYLGVSQSKAPGVLQLAGNWRRRLQAALRNDTTAHFFRSRHLYARGRKVGLGCMCVVLALCGLINNSPNVAYTMDGHNRLVDDKHLSAVHASQPEEVQHAILAFARKFWMPVLFFFTVITNLDYPIRLASRVLLFLLSTKPSPLSVYIFIEKLCQQHMLQEPHLYKLKSLYASRVDVNDYLLLCLAEVELRNKQFTLIGILGGWWVLPPSPFQAVFSLSRNSASERY